MKRKKKCSYYLLSRQELLELCLKIFDRTDRGYINCEDSVIGILGNFVKLKPGYTKNEAVEIQKMFESDNKNKKNKIEMENEETASICKCINCGWNQELIEDVETCERCGRIINKEIDKI